MPLDRNAGRAGAYGRTEAVYDRDCHGTDYITVSIPSKIFCKRNDDRCSERLIIEEIKENFIYKI